MHMQAKLIPFCPEQSCSERKLFSQPDVFYIVMMTPKGRKAEPIYVQIARELRKEITGGDFQEGDRLPSTKVFCARFNVSHPTILLAIRALSNEGLIEVKPGLGSFVASKKHSDINLALVLPSLGYEQSGEISFGVRQGLRAAGQFKISIFDYHHDPLVEEECLQRILQEGFNCAIVFPSMTGKASKLLLQMVVNGFPIVFVDRKFVGVPSWYVGCDDYQGGFAAGMHLVDQGCRQCACISTRLPNVLKRVDGFKTALLERGERVDHRLLIEIEDTVEAAEKATRELFEGPNVPDGIFYHNDYDAIAGIRCLRSRGIKVPEKVKVVGFDDIAAASLSDPPLTTIHQQPALIGQRAAELLIQQLACSAENRFVEKECLTPVELIFRQSTAKA